MRVGNRTGVVRPAHAAAVGKAILAGLTERELARLYPDDRLPESATGTATTDLGALRAELAEVRALGYAVNWEETTEGVCAVAAALKDTVGQPLAGLGIAAPISRMKDVAAIRALAPAVLRGAELVRERLPVTR